VLPAATVTVVIAVELVEKVGIRVFKGDEADEAAAEASMAKVVKGIKVVELASFLVVEDFEGFTVVKGMGVEVDALDQEVNVVDNKIDVFVIGEEVGVVENEVLKT
jgi:hypothetical protein